ncbi:hypothetical protein P7H17_26245 [Paenibacillus larvae]|nr:hypothetical protein [Paenibacillus larvae]MDT2288852.1 hypothetical protein [Paenibacillus larvae]
MNGCQDHTFDIAKQHPTATVLSYNEPVGHDVGRTIGAKVAVSDILLLLMRIFPSQQNSLSLIFVLSSKVRTWH